MMMMMSQRWSFWSIGFGVLPPKSLPFPSIDDDDDDDDDVAVFAAASRRMRVVHCYRSATAVSMMRAYVLGLKRERKRPHIEAKCFPKSSSFPLETAKVFPREKKKRRRSRRRRQRRRRSRRNACYFARRDLTTAFIIRTSSTFFSRRRSGLSDWKRYELLCLASALGI